MEVALVFVQCWVFYEHQLRFVEAMAFEEPLVLVEIFHLEFDSKGFVKGSQL